MRKTLDDMIDESVEGVTDGWTTDARNRVQRAAEREWRAKNAEIDRQVAEIIRGAARDECPFWVTVDRQADGVEVTRGKPTPDDPPGHPVEALEITAETYDRFLEEYEGGR